MDVVVLGEPEEVTKEAGRRVLDFVLANPEAALGLATGATQVGIYQFLVESYRAGQVSFAANRFFMLDEYAGVPATSPHSFQHVVRSEFLDHVDAAPGALNILDGNAPDLAAEADRFEQLLVERGGIDLQMLGIGTNSHIGFNEPGSPLDSRTRVIDLHDATIHANSVYFDSEADVPRQAISQGLGTIAEAKTVLLLATGERKALAVRAMIDGKVSSEQPASILQRHRNTTVILDTAAASLLSAMV